MSSRNPKTMTTCGNHILVAKTCRLCGLLKMAHEYGFRAATGSASAYYNSHCKGCGGSRANRSNKKMNDASLEKATNYREIWTKDELETLQRLLGLGLSSRDIASRIGRTISSVANMLQRLREQGEEHVQGVRLCYYESSTDTVRQVGITYVLARKGHRWRLEKAAQELSELHKQLIFFITVDGGGEYMGIRGLDSLKQGDDRESEDTSEDLEVLAHPSQNEN